MYSFHREHDLLPCWQDHPLDTLDCTWVNMIHEARAPLPMMWEPAPAPPTCPMDIDEEQQNTSQDSDEYVEPGVLCALRPSYSYIGDSFLMAALLHEGATVSQNADGGLVFEVWDFPRLHVFIHDLPGLPPRHAHVSENARIKGLAVWFTGNWSNLRRNETCYLFPNKDSREKVLERLEAVREHLKSFA
jgi:hypothetical protein